MPPHDVRLVRPKAHRCPAQHQQRRQAALEELDRMPHAVALTRLAGQHQNRTGRVERIVRDQGRPQRLQPHRNGIGQRHENQDGRQQPPAPPPVLHASALAYSELR